MRWYNTSILDKSTIIWQAQPAEFGVPKGRKRAGRGKPAIAGAAPANKQKETEPRRKEWAAEASASMCNRRLYHPLTTFGVQIIFMVSRGSVASRLHPCLCSDVPAGLRIPQAAPAR